ncbi:MAG TPA: 3-hydroxyacyl-ACP dehydratase FabZ family protein [Candidatus Udaeobacter sp.]|nr:3-hydroxyacyl-ACP dehydratase FabZ family protein [Candidatus Udaeobacter sp.]
MRLEYFQLVDRVEEIDPVAGVIRTTAQVPDKSTIFEGHFEGFPILPGVLLVECMAQTAGHLVLVLEKFVRMPFLTQIERAKLRRFVEPGQRLSVTGRLVHLGSGYAVASGKIESDAGLVAEAEVRFRTLPFPNDAMRQIMLKEVRRLGLEVPPADESPAP